MANGAVAVTTSPLKANVNVTPAGAVNVNVQFGPFTVSGSGFLLASNNLSDVANTTTAFNNIKQAASTSYTGVVEFATDGESAPLLAIQANDSRLTSAANSITALTGDGTATGPGSVPLTLATVNSNVGTFGSATQVAQATVNAKGLVTAVSNVTITPAASSITGLGTGVAAALAVNVGTDGAFVVKGGALGTPSSGVATNLTGLPISTGVSGLGTGIATALAINTGSAGAPILFNGNAGTPSALVGTNISGFANSLTAGTALAWQTPRTLAITGDLTYTSPAFNGSANVTAAGTIANSAVTLAKIANAAANSKLLGSGAAGAGAPYVELTLGTNLSISGTTLNATGGGGTGDVVGPASATDGAFALFDTTTGKLIKNSSAPGAGVMTFLATPSSANLAAAVTGETGTGALVFGTAPTFATKITVGTNAATTGSIDLVGATSGIVTVKSADAAGTWTLTLPTTDGASGEVLTTDGAGVTSWQAGSGSGDMLKSVYDPQNLGYISGDTTAFGSGGYLSMDAGTGGTSDGGQVWTYGGNNGPGGNIHTYGGTNAGGSIYTNDGGGIINTTVKGYIEFGYFGQRTTLSGTATSDRTIDMPDSSGTLLLDDGDGSALTGITATQVGLGNVTNDTQTKAAIVPNTTPSAGQILAGNAGGTAYAPVSMSGDATLASTGALTLATVNSNVGSFGSATAATIFTVNAKGLITAASSATITPAVGSITGLGTGVATALAVNVGSAGAFVTFNGAGGTPSSLTGTNITGTATGLTSGITNALKSTSTTVDVSAATAPSAGQVLTATSSMAATWQASSSGLPAGYGYGCLLANNGSDANNDLDIATGKWRSSDDTADVALASALVKQLDAAWAVGTNQGGQYQSATLTGTIVAAASTTVTGTSTTFTTDFVVGDVIWDNVGAIGRRITAIASDTSLTVESAWTVAALSGYKRGGKAPSTWYGVWLIRRSDTGVVDIIANASVSAALTNLPTSYDAKRLIGFVYYNASSVLSPFKGYAFGTQRKFDWVTPVSDANGVTLGTSDADLTISVPPGVSVLASVLLGVTKSGAQPQLLVWNSDTVVNPLLANVFAFVTSAVPQTGPVQLQTNTSAQLRWKTNQASSTAYLSTGGYIWSP